MSTHKPSFLDDTRGGLLVVGIALGALMVGGLWHLASVGDAIAWRERAQDVADAAAYENAVWHARGMNTLATFNVLMASVLSILIIWRTIMVLLALAIVLASVICILTLGLTCAWVPPVISMEVAMARHDTRVATNVIRIMSGLQLANVAVASATPIVAFGMATGNTRRTYDVPNLWTESFTFLPSLPTKQWMAMKLCFTGLRTGKLPPKPDPKGRLGHAYRYYEDNLSIQRMGFPVSLPVSLSDFGSMCKHSGEAVFANMAAVLKLLNAPGGAVKGIRKAGKIFGEITGNLVGIFCSPLGRSDPPETMPKKDLAKVRKQCESNLTSAEEQTPDGPRYKSDDGTLVSRDEYVDACSKKAENNYTQAGARLEEGLIDRMPDKGTYDLNKCAGGVKTWAATNNGSLFQRTFAQVRMNPPLLASDDKFLDFMDGARTGALVPAPTKEVTAHAEFYSDCKGNWTDCMGKAMWETRWRARLRRVHPMDKLLGTIVEPVLNAIVAKFVFEKVAEAGDATIDKLRIPKIIVPRLKDTAGFRDLKDQFQLFLNRSHVNYGGYRLGKWLKEREQSDATVH